MDKQAAAPDTLIDAIRYFKDDAVGIAFLVEMRWPDGVVKCPTCGSPDVGFLSSRRLWKCKTNHPRRQFSIKVGTIFEDSPIGLDKWLAAMWLIANAKNGVSSYEIGRALGLTQKTGWFMLHRIRLAMQDGTIERMRGRVEVDETFIGGAARFMHRGKKEARRIGARAIGKTAVMGLLERHGPDKTSRVRAFVVPSNRRTALDPKIRANVTPGSEVLTDALASYDSLEDQYTHNVIDHAESYVRGHIHTNGMENFWSLLKRAIKGTYVSVEPFHLFRYVDEEVFRFNRRALNDAQRFVLVARSILGRRLTYKGLTGALATTPA